MEIAGERGEQLKIVTLKSGQRSDGIAEAFEAGRLTALDAAPAIDTGIIRDTSNIVALAGIEQIKAALDTGADIIIAGRATDTAVIAALPIARGATRVRPGMAPRSPNAALWPPQIRIQV